MEFINPFEIFVGIVVLLIIVGVWIVNRRRVQEGKSPFHVEVEVISIVVTVIGLTVVFIARSGVVSEQPVLFGVGVLVFLSFLGSTANLIVAHSMKKEVDQIIVELGRQMAGLGNVQYYSTKEETFKHLVNLTYGAKEKLIATRFSPADISVETDYWHAMKKRAFDPSILYVRIHSLAHSSSMCIEGVCKLIAEFKGAPMFRLAIAFYNNDFELILADDKECIFCFHDLELTIKDGFKVDTSSPNSAAIVADMGFTLRRMLERCYIVVDFEKFVRTDREVEQLQNHLRRMHQQFVTEGKIPRPVHPSEMEVFLRREVFVD